MKIFCSGIGGIGLSAYAGLMQACGHTVRGSDKAKTKLTESLIRSGIDVSYDQSGGGVTKDTDLFVYSEAIPKDAPERTKATELGITQMSYFQAVGALSKGKDVVCIAGSHGKSSTTAMIAKLCIDAGLDPTVLLGTTMKDMHDKNWHKGASDLWIIEACEYRKSFLYQYPKTIVLTTVDVDHFDAFKNQDEFDRAFIEFVKLLPNDGVLIGHGNDEHVARIARDAGHALTDADTEILPELSVPGLHMRQNAQLALAFARSRGIAMEAAKRSLYGFSGTWRRMEVRGTMENGALVIDDYGHHPIEIRATLKGIKEAYPNRRLLLVYQPHMHNRTKVLWNDFAHAFSNADLLLLSDVYDARPDTEDGGADMTQLAADIRKGSGTEVVPSGDLMSTLALTKEHAKPDDVVVVMGAGTVTEIADALTD